MSLQLSVRGLFKNPNNSKCTEINAEENKEQAGGSKTNNIANMEQEHSGSK